MKQIYFDFSQMILLFGSRDISETKKKSIMDVPKKRIPRAEFHGIFLDFVEMPKKRKVRIFY